MKTALETLTRAEEVILMQCEALLESSVESTDEVTKPGTRTNILKDSPGKQAFSDKLKWPLTTIVEPTEKSIKINKCEMETCMKASLKNSKLNYVWLSNERKLIKNVSDLETLKKTVEKQCKAFPEDHAEETPKKYSNQDYHHKCFVGIDDEEIISGIRAKD